MFSIFRGFSLHKQTRPPTLRRRFQPHQPHSTKINEPVDTAVDNKIAAGAVGFALASAAFAVLIVDAAAEADTVEADTAPVGAAAILAPTDVVADPTDVDIVADAAAAAAGLEYMANKDFGVAAVASYPPATRPPTKPTPSSPPGPLKP